MNVSRETTERLEHYASLLRKWNTKINLVAKSTIGDLWQRHIEDSLQLCKHIPDNTKHLVDIGSGGGFPGLVIAIESMVTGNPSSTTMIESDQRKCAFIRTVLRETDSKADVLSQRIEQVPPQNTDVITARALADLSSLFEYAERHLSSTGTALFLKGKNWRNEIEQAQNKWKFEWDAVESTTDSDAALLIIRGLSRD